MDEDLYQKVIKMDKLKEELLRVGNKSLNILLKSLDRSVNVDNSAILQFSISNLTSNKNIEVDLNIEIPTGLSVEESTFQQGGGQFLSSYEVDPSEVKSDRIQINSNSTGSYKISARAIYNYTGEQTERNSSTQEILIRYYDPAQ